MNSVQAAILQPNPPLARFMTFSIHSKDGIKHCLQELREIVDGESLVIGFGISLLQALNKSVDGLHAFPALSHDGLDIPSTQAALWCWLRGDDRGELFHQSRLIESLLMPAFTLADCIDSFQFDQVRDLSGYEDGTENPAGEEAIAAAIVQGQGSGLDGSSFVAVQQWLHDFDSFDAMSTEQQDDTIGRHISDNEEFDEAPESAHVKRSAQESFAPEAFMLRHSMPWAEDTEGGLVFVAFGKSVDAFEAILQRMLGLEDGIQDALFSFTHPISGSYFWCPPMQETNLDLSALDM
ncbi:MAG: Dyp-type peroxidase [Gammaproteobacteria bacterium]|nr:Dyp-type peroxidase [Gammaproteobacteria bacterium]